jgi:hypothetical protein
MTPTGLLLLCSFGLVRYDLTVTFKMLSCRFLSNLNRYIPIRKLCHLVYLVRRFGRQKLKNILLAFSGSKTHAIITILWNLSTREENFPLSNFLCICDWGLNRIVSTISSGLFPIHLWNPPCFTTHERRLQTLILGLHGWIINIKQLVLACYLFIYGNSPALQHMLGDSKP